MTQKIFCISVYYYSSIQNVFQKQDQRSQAEFLKIFRLEANTNIKKDMYNKHMLMSQQDAIQVGGGEDGN